MDEHRDAGGVDEAQPAEVDHDCPAGFALRAPQLTLEDLGSGEVELAVELQHAHVALGVGANDELRGLYRASFRISGGQSSSPPSAVSDSAYISSGASVGSSTNSSERMSGF